MTVVLQLVLPEPAVQLGLLLPNQSVAQSLSIPTPPAPTRVIIGPPSPYNDTGDGFIVVGNELRLDIDSLPTAT